MKSHILSYAKRGVVKQEIDSMLVLGMKGKAESPYNSPVVLFKKKDGANRFGILLPSP